MADLQNDNCGRFKQAICGTYMGVTKTCAGVCWQWPGDKDLIKCTDNNKIYKYNGAEKKLYLVPDQTIGASNNSYNKLWGSNGGNSNCADTRWGTQTTQTNRGEFASVTTAPEGSSVKCYEKNPETVYRWANGKLFGYPTQDIANSWDPSWNSGKTYACGTIDSSISMTKKPATGEVIKCTDNADKFYSYKDNKLTYYPEISDTILKQYGGYSGPEWNSTMVRNENCEQYNSTRDTLNPNIPLNTDTPDGTSLKCYNQEPGTVLMYAKENDTLMYIPTAEIGFTWKLDWFKTKLYDCSRIWGNRQKMTQKPSDGSIVKCSDDNQYYRYAADNNNLILYETSAIAKQYSTYQTIESTEINIATANKIPFAINPTIDMTKPPTYTFSFECCIEKTSGGLRNIMNHGANDTPTNSDGRRPYVSITGGDYPPANRIQITHASDGNDSGDIVADTSTFVATPGQWFTITFIVNRAAKLTYFNGNKDKHINYGSNFNWGVKNTGGWYWSFFGPSNDGFIKIRNARFWTFAMALDVPTTFNPIDVTDEINPYTSKPTGNQVITTSLPNAINCKAFTRKRSQIIETAEINVALGKRAFTVTPTVDMTKRPSYTFSFECCIEKTSGGLRNIMNHGKIDTPVADTITGDTRRPSIAITPQNSINIVHASDIYPNANMVSNFIATNGVWFTVKFIVNNNEMLTYFNGIKDKSVIDAGLFNWGAKNAGDWNWGGVINDGFVKIRNAVFSDFDTNATKFIPTIPIASTTIKDGDSLKCSTSIVYRYNQDNNKLFGYPTAEIANSWDKNWSNYKSYNCENNASSTANMELRPINNAVIKCNNDQKSYRYISDTNSLEWYMNDTIIKQYDTNWNGENISRNCDQFKTSRPTFVPTQKLDNINRIADGTPVKCNNTSEIYRYNDQYNMLMKYPNETIANTWDSKAYSGFYSYDCNLTKGTKDIDIKPLNNSVVKCINNPGESISIANPNLYYIYDSESNTLRPKSTIESIQSEFPSWKSSDLKTMDCKPFTIRDSTFYDGPGATLSNYKVDISGCVPLPKQPSDVATRSLVRNGENIVLYTDEACKNIYKTDNGEKGKDQAIDIAYSGTNAFGEILKESNPSHYKVVSSDEYNLIYNM